MILIRCLGEYVESMLSAINKVFKTVNDALRSLIRLAQNKVKPA